MQRFLITGASGFIGARIATLLEASVALHTLSRNPNPPHTRAIHHSADLRDPHALQQIVADSAPNVILHLAATGVTEHQHDMAHLLAVNVLGTANLLAAAATQPQPPHVIIAGSWFEYAAPTDTRPLQESGLLSAKMPYSASKLAAQALAQHYAQKMPLTWLRVFSVYGVGERLPRLAPYIIEQARHTARIELTACEQVRDYVYVDDIAHGFMVAAQHPPQDGTLRVLNLASGNGVRLRDFVQQLALHLAARGLSPEIDFGAKPYRPDELMHAVGDVRRQRQTFDWQPQISLNEGLARMVAHQLDQSD